MANLNQPEVWQRGPVENIPALLQPVAHALLQAREEVIELMMGFADVHLWNKPAGVASVGFHLQHLAGVLDRVFTYAKAKPLNEHQLTFLSMEGQVAEVASQHLIKQFNEQVDKALQQLSTTNEQSLLEIRGIGRAQIPTTVLGLLFHAAEHTMRHVGQLYVTVKVLQANFPAALPANAE